ncbi:hypothetical protein [Varunaivibrio sulfuroxidans]|uniref:hypothetical protein n=1 Tax=Varunaivibrio sulfuroxidans TaxID=1773489 RepID=UPI001044F7A2|nr:hypothetical protein [Varunaivibrio sulfuroxidans]WES31006.1 hypothetical protein P3M64_01105 [Varunaivibrio sulfuroxidans]
MKNNGISNGVERLIQIIKKNMVRSLTDHESWVLILRCAAALRVDGVLLAFLNLAMVEGGDCLVQA